jgi:drug/metabolite transporter (DMT)-like permease
MCWLIKLSLILSNMTGILIALAGTVCWAICVFPFTIAGRLMSVASMNLFRLVVGTILVMLLAFLFETKNMSAIFSHEYINAWIWLGLSGIIALGIGDYFNYRMYVILSPRYGSVLSTLSPAAALILGIKLLDEHINLTGITGMLITIIGVMSMSLGRTERSNIPDHGYGSIFKGIVFGVFSAICNGAGLALSKKGFLTQAAAGHPIPALTASSIRFITATVIVIFVTFLNKKLLANWKNIIAQPRKTLGIAFTGIIFGPLLGVSFALTAIQYIDVAVAQTIFALVPVVALLMSHFIYKERITRYAFAGVLAAVAGVAVLIWRNDIQHLF